MSGFFPNCSNFLSFQVLTFQDSCFNHFENQSESGQRLVRVNC